MTAKNDITGDDISSGGNSEAYREGHDRIFGKKETRVVVAPPESAVQKSGTIVTMVDGQASWIDASLSYRPDQPYVSVGSEGATGHYIGVIHARPSETVEFVTPSLTKEQEAALLRGETVRLGGITGWIGDRVTDGRPDQFEVKDGCPVVTRQVGDSIEIVKTGIVTVGGHLAGEPEPEQNIMQSGTTVGLVVNHDEAKQLAHVKYQDSNLARCYLDLLEQLKPKADAIPDAPIMVEVTQTEEQVFSDGVRNWVTSTFGAEAAADKVERGHRFLEEALELAQAAGVTENEAYQILEYTYNRMPGRVDAEVGDVMLTLYALIHAYATELPLTLGHNSLLKGWAKQEAIRVKWLNKPQFNMTPIASDPSNRQFNMFAAATSAWNGKWASPAHRDGSLGNSWDWFWSGVQWGRSYTKQELGAPK